MRDEKEAMMTYTSSIGRRRDIEWRGEGCGLAEEGLGRRHIGPLGHGDEGDTDGIFLQANG